MIDLDAGAYAAFVWAAYGLSLLLLVALAVDSVMRARRWRREAEKAERER